MLNSLPCEILIEVISKLNYSDIIHLSSTCSHMKQFTINNLVKIFKILKKRYYYLDFCNTEKATYQNFITFFKNYIIHKKKNLILIKSIYNYSKEVKKSNLLPYNNWIDSYKIINTMENSLMLLSKFNNTKTSHKYSSIPQRARSISTINFITKIIDKHLPEKYLRYEIPKNIMCINIGILKNDYKIRVYNNDEPIILDTNTKVPQNFKIKINLDDIRLFD